MARFRISAVPGLPQKTTISFCENESSLDVIKCSTPAENKMPTLTFFQEENKVVLSTNFAMPFEKGKFTEELCKTSLHDNYST